MLQIGMTLPADCLVGPTNNQIVTLEACDADEADSDSLFMKSV